MLQIKKRLKTIAEIINKNNLKYECIKICILYFLIGFLWIYFSDNLVINLFNNRKMILIANTYKGWFYVIVTTIILYLLINSLAKKVNLATAKQDLTNRELEAANDELQAYIEQLTAAEEELRAQYNQITENEKALRLVEEKNRKIVEAIPDVLFILDYNGNFIDCQANNEKLLLVPKEAIIGKNVSEILPDEISEIFFKKAECLLSTRQLQTFQYQLEGEHFEIRMVINGDNQILAILRNITAETQNRLKLEYISYHDELTSLYNRRFFQQQLLELNKTESLPLAIVAADVNGLKLVNDSFGHFTGDKLLKKVSEVLKKSFIKNAIITRFGGDEFVILLPNSCNADVEEMILSASKLAGKEIIGSLKLSISFGYAVKSSENEDINKIYKSAEDNMYKRKLFESKSMRGHTINTIIKTLHEKNKREEAHSHRVSLLCESMAKNLCLTVAETQELKTAGLLHDIGKIAIEENVLNKPGKLSDEEWQEIRRHPEIGYRILCTSSNMSEIADYCLYHHEAWNGTGYPKGLKMEEIPLQSRIINIADSFDAMTSDRSYRKALPEEVAVKELKDKAGIQFDPKLVKIFIEKVLKKYFN